MSHQDAKRRSLEQQGILNPHPERVRAPWFQSGAFFDARDLVQVKYEMLRQVHAEGMSKAEAATLFGVSRPTFYQAEAAFAAQGLAGLLPRRRGPRGAHKLTAEVMALIEDKRGADPAVGARALAHAVQAELGLRVHPRSIERALARKKNAERWAGLRAGYATQRLRAAARRGARRSGTTRGAGRGDPSWLAEVRIPLKATTDSA